MNRLRSFAPPIFIALAFATAIVAPGCSRSDRPPLGEVSGTVTLDGEPLAGAVVTFRPQGARASVGVTDDNGRYELTYLRAIRGAVVGDHQVAVYTADEDHPGERLPERYNHESTLSRTVSPGRNSFDFELRSQ